MILYIHLTINESHVQLQLDLFSISHSTKLRSSSLAERSAELTGFSSTDSNIRSVFSAACASAPPDKTVIFQNTLSISLFFTTLLDGDRVNIQGMLDSEFMLDSLYADLVPQLKGLK